MIRFLDYFWKNFVIANFDNVIISFSLVIFYLFINFFALSNLFYSSKGIKALAELNYETNQNLRELKTIREKNLNLEKKIKSMVDFKDADLVDQTIREYLGYAKEDDFIIRLDKID